MGVRLFKENQIKLPKQVKILGDSGYQGIKILHPNSQTPIKSSKLIKLTKGSKERKQTTIKSKDKCRTR